MIYLIKIAYTLVFPPGLFILAMLAIAIYLYRRQERRGALYAAIAALLLWIASMPATGGAMLSSLERRYDPPAQATGDVLVMLTGGATPDTPDPASRGEGHPLANTAGRILTLAELYRQTQLPIIVSGGQVFSDTGNESRIAKRHLVALGVPEAAIRIDDTSLNTAENALHTQQIMQKEGWKRPVLVTSAFHMARSVKQFRKLGVTVTPYPTDYTVARQQNVYPSKFIPSYTGLNMTGMALKEYVGLLAIR